MRLNTLRVLTLFVALTTTSYTRAQGPSADCSSARQVALAPQFNPSAAIKLLITDFSAADTTQASQDVAQALPIALAGAFPTFLRKVLDGQARAIGLAPGAFSIAHISCVVRSHRTARELGAALGANLVLWGTARSTGMRDVRTLTRELTQAVKGIRVASDNVIDAPNAAQVRIVGTVNIRVKAPPPGAEFQTSLTSVDWAGLETDGASRKLHGILDQEFPKLATREPTALFYLVLGNYAFGISRFSAAAHYFERTTDTVFAEAEHIDLIYWNIARSATFATQYAKALKYIEKALAACGDKDCEALHLNNKGWIYRQAGKLEEAIASWEQAMKIAHETDNTYVYATAQHNLIRVNRREKLASLEENLELRRRAGDKIGEAHTLNLIVGVYFGLGDLVKARELELEALASLKDANYVNTTQELQILAYIEFRLGNREQALAAAEEGVRVSRLMGDVGVELMLLCDVFDLATRLEYPAAADRAAQLFRRDAQPKQIAKVSRSAMLNGIGKMFFNLGDFAEAAQAYARAIAVLQREGDKAGESLLRNNLGRVYFRQRQSEKAAKEYKIGLSLVENDETGEGQRARGHLVHNLGLLAVERGNNMEAAHNLLQAIKIRRTTRQDYECSESLEALADIQHQDNLPREAARSRLDAADLSSVAPERRRKLLAAALLDARFASDQELEASILAALAVPRGTVVARDQQPAGPHL